MSSPFRALSPKKDSLLNSRSSSPLKSKPSTPAKNQAQNMRKLPKLGVDLTPKNLSSAGFQIYEDKPEEYQLYHKSRDEEVLLHDDKENILQPKVMVLPQKSQTRQPLANLSITQYPGHMLSVGQVSRQPIALTQLYQPNNYDNEAKTTHKFNHLPSFVTPPRNALRKILYRSGTAEDNAETDEIELRLMAKSHSVARHRRAMSVGVNKGKKHLVQKSRVEIFTS